MFLVASSQNPKQTSKIFRKKMNKVCKKGFESLNIEIDYEIKKISKKECKRNEEILKENLDYFWDSSHFNHCGTLGEDNFHNKNQDYSELMDDYFQ
jgi:hypothetical protein